MLTFPIHLPPQLASPITTNEHSLTKHHTFPPPQSQSESLLGQFTSYSLQALKLRYKLHISSKSSSVSCPPPLYAAGGHHQRALLNSTGRLNPLPPWVPARSSNSSDANPLPPPNMPYLEYKNKTFILKEHIRIMVLLKKTKTYAT